MSEERRDAWKDRAPRQPVTKFARLKWPVDEEVVVLKDVSRSGVRLLLPRATRGQLADAVYRVELVLGFGGDQRVLQVALARVCGVDDKHMDVAFRFIGEALTDEELQTLGNIFFDRGPP